MKKLDHDTALSVTAIHNNNIDIPNRELYLCGEEAEWCEGDEPGVNHVMAIRLLRNLRILDGHDHAPILIHMKTCGGDWIEGMAIYDMIKACVSPVTILSYTHARSMSSIILQAADFRVLMPNSYFMYHHGSYGIEGDWQSVMSNVEWDKKCEKTMFEIYAECMVTTKHGKYYRQDADKVIRMMKRQMDSKTDVFFTAQETVECGLADAVFDGNWVALREYE